MDMDPERFVQILTQTGNVDIVIKYIGIMLQSYKLGLPIADKKYAGFKNLESYLEYVQAKLFLDLILKKYADDVTTAKGLPGYNIINYSALHLDKFHMPPEERTQGRQDFFNNISTDDIVDCVVIHETEKQYDLLVLRKHFNIKRLLPYCIPAHHSKSLTFQHHYENGIKKHSIVRVSVTGTRQYESDSQECVLLVTFEQSKKHREIKLGVLEKYPSALDFEDVNQQTQCRSLTEFVKHNFSPADYTRLNNHLPSLGIQPDKVYSFHPKLDGKILASETQAKIIIQGEKIQKKAEQNRRKYLLELKEKNEFVKLHEIAIDCMKRMIERKNFKRAAEYLQVGVDILKENGRISSEDELQCNNQIEMLNSLNEENLKNMSI